MSVCLVHAGLARGLRQQHMRNLMCVTCKAVCSCNRAWRGGCGGCGAPRRSGGTAPQSRRPLPLRRRAQRLPGAAASRAGHPPGLPCRRAAARPARGRRCCGVCLRAAGGKSAEKPSRPDGRRMADELRLCCGLQTMTKADTRRQGQQSCLRSDAAHFQGGCRDSRAETLPLCCGWIALHRCPLLMCSSVGARIVRNVRDAAGQPQVLQSHLRAKRHG